MEAAVDAAIVKEDAAHALKQPTAASNDSPSAKQLDLIDHGIYSHHTQSAAAASAAKRRPTLKAAIVEHLSSVPSGCTRLELADALDAPHSSICSAVAELLPEGRLVETSLKRVSRYGQPATILVLGSGATT